ncbi:uncharacterized protein GGS22DRAFT_186440 [Annulohypoxylon maeteangense]|uniref:uncharacterized protein n=1 Tax=Annulohypoxylon maeteangense TaxID=1927788 RepID=UPI002007A9FB|nr:uncharacterized protein GGS22DRAFT_186440 [Annulohypoxylon maeteangense]KAI0887608.1 hypothetical protein GGS22DRAFT_186440 [Annulohypoxylon maeteangense]
MRFTLSSVLIALAVTSAVASPADSGEKRSAASKFGTCNGTSCRVGFYNKVCGSGSCAGPQGGDGKPCSIVDYPNGSNKAFCPGCGDSSLCPDH